MKITLNFDDVVFYHLHVADLTIFFINFLHFSVLLFFLDFEVIGMSSTQSFDNGLILSLNMLTSFTLANQTSIYFILLVFSFARGNEEMIDETLLIN